MRKWTDEEEQILINNGTQMTSSEILELLPNKTLQQLRDKMYKNGIKISQEAHSRSHRIYNINDEFFRSQSHNMSYILGLWWSDGSIAPSHTGYLNEFNITLKDEEKLLTEIRNEMGANIPLKIHKKTGSFVLKIFSRKICQDLITIGGCQNKSKNLNWPKIDDEFIPAFIRGYFDGDGCVHYKQKRWLGTTFSCGDKSFLNTLHKKIKSIDTTIKGGWLNDQTSVGGNWSVLGFGENDSIKLAKIIYSENTGTLYMTRKYEKFIDFYVSKFNQKSRMKI
jgi:hypothetical protein